MNTVKGREGNVAVSSNLRSSVSLPTSRFINPSSRWAYMRVNWHYIIVVPSNSCTFMNQALCMNGDEMYVGMSGGAACEPGSSSCKEVQPWRADWLHTRTQSCRAQCTPGPLERALVTPHKRIQSLKSRGAGSGRRGLSRSVAAIFKRVRSLLGQGNSWGGFNVGAPSRSLHNSDRCRRRRPADPGSCRIYRHLAGPALHWPGG